ncbi:hypothetical protein ACFFLM_15340, partial [Deinococcus oregonensis]
MMVEIQGSGVEAQKFLRSFPSSESKLLLLLTSWRTVRLQGDVVAACRRDHLLVVDALQPGE